jgi:S1-C subfamily serine protease
MTLVDWAIIALLVVFAPVGYSRGLLVAGLGLVGFGIGAAIGARVAPLLLEGGSGSPYAPAIALLGGILLGGLAAALLEGFALNVRARLPAQGALASADSIGGAIAFIGLGLAVAWVAGALALNAPALREVREDAQRSVILSALNDVLPPSGPVLNVLNRVSPTPQIDGPSADVPPAGDGILDDSQVLAAQSSVVHVIGTACGLNVSGSGWVADDDVVVTNAHVVAGQDDTEVVTRSGTQLDAAVIAYEPDEDLAVLRVDGLDAPPLPLAPEAKFGTVGAVLGYPGEGDFLAIPARMGTTGEVTSQDSYGDGPIQREMTSFRADVQAGNSGGPIVDGRGRVQATVFAATVDVTPSEGLAVPNDRVRKVLGDAGAEVDTGACT